MQLTRSLPPRDTATLTGVSNTAAPVTLVPLSAGNRTFGKTPIQEKTTTLFMLFGRLGPVKFQCGVCVCVCACVHAFVCARVCVRACVCPCI